MHSKLPDAKESSDNNQEAITKHEEEKLDVLDVTIQRNSDESSSAATAKRVKYDSPLDFQKVPTISEDKYENCRKNFNFKLFIFFFASKNSKYDSSLKIIE